MEMISSSQACNIYSFQMCQYSHAHMYEIVLLFLFLFFPADALNKKSGISFSEKQKMMIKQIGSSMFKSKINTKEKVFNENVMKKIRKRLQIERDMQNLAEISKKSNIHDVIKSLPDEIASAFLAKEQGNEQTSYLENKQYPTELMKGLYGIQKNIVLKNITS